jgi:hypothetical protein
MKKLSLLFLGVALSLNASAAWQITPYGYFSSKADVKGSSNKASYSVYGFDAKNEHFGFGYKRTSYDFDRKEGFDDLNLIYGSVNYADQLVGNLGYAVGTYLSFGFEDEIKVSKSYDLVPTAALTYDFENDWSMIAGAGVSFNKANNFGFGIIGLKYREPSDMGLSASIAYPRTMVNYRFTQVFAVGADAGAIRGGHYYLDNSRTYAFEKGYEANLYALITPISQLSIKAGVGYNIDRQIKFYENRTYVGKMKFENETNFFVNGSLSF